MFNLSILLESSTSKYADRNAFTYETTSLTYAQLNGAVNQVANGLVQSGIQKGDKVALSCLNIPYFPIIYFGILKAGAVVVPLSVLLKENEVAYHLQDSEAKAYFCFVGNEALPMGERGYKGFNDAPNCKDFYMIMPTPTMESPIKGTKTLGMLMNGQSPGFEFVMTSPEDMALIIYTSGTTGKPKGAELSHSNIFMNAMLCKDLLGLTHEDKSLVSLPLFHIFSMTVLMVNTVYCGAEGILLARFDPQVAIDIMVKHKITIFAGVPTMYWALTNFEADEKDIEAIGKNLKTAVSGGASLPVNVLESFEKKFDVQIIEGYGMSEGSPVVTFNQKDVGCKPGSIGTPIWGVQVKLVDAEGNEVPQGEKGELIYKGHNVMKGYYKKPEANAETIKNGWLYSGDIATKDEDGFYYIVDRTKDMIIRGGLNVYPREVEDVMMDHEAVSLVAVIGVPNEAKGEEIKACVVLKPDTSVSEDELMAWTKERTADYKYPRIIDFMDALPMSATGKILKKELRK
ncbi:MAG TPA: long-chain-fatty-acid--CoA ligase [Flavobacteriaceae bacterium]|jgi:long-chain acyl-CoA synthetase|nr:long-chain-fatty-acid--CoA ligase [Flavobacteriaceae bacterium]HBS11575.1 long-chain-fatty-acid--CoA ligase [Flavobacteriaceae bacterium]